MTAPTATIDPLDRRLIRAAQDGLPLCPRPYHALAEALDTTPEAVMARLRRMQELGIVRRIGAVPNHYRLGFTANGMSVWDVDDAEVGEVGTAIGRFDFVSHCYRRPRHPPDWPYNLFAMVHGRSPAEVEDKVAAVAEFVGRRARAYEVLYSTRILKKTGLRLGEG
jgi:DNA-binding Lrp family transcriptional regulator